MGLLLATGARASFATHLGFELGDYDVVAVSLGDKALGANAPCVGLSHFDEPGLGASQAWRLGSAFAAASRDPAWGPAFHEGSDFRAS